MQIFPDPFSTADLEALDQRVINKRFSTIPVRPALRNADFNINPWLQVSYEFTFI